MVNKKKVLVLGAQYGALGVIKALAIEGIQSILLDPNPHDHASHSRFISQQVIIPNPKDDSDRLLDILMNNNGDWEGALLLPTIDEYVIFISQKRGDLSKKFLFTTQDWEVTKKLINKDLLYTQAQEVGIPTPKYFLPDSIESLNEQQNEFLYPCILKPYESYRFRDIYKKKVLMVHNYQELYDMFKNTCQNHQKVMISEIIPGDDSSIFTYRSYIDRQGDVIAELCTQKLRQYPVDFGQTAVARTIPILPEIRDQALKLLHSLTFYGESSAEFRLDHRDNKYKLMEINIRPVVSEWHFAKAGVNFPYITYLDLVENIRTTIHKYRHEFYWIHNHWEIANFIGYLRSGNLNLMKFLAPYWKEKVYAVPFADDPIHFFTEIYFNAFKVFRKTKQ